LTKPTGSQPARVYRWQGSSWNREGKDRPGSPEVEVQMENNWHSGKEFDGFEGKVGRWLVVVLTALKRLFRMFWNVRTHKNQLPEDFETFPFQLSDLFPDNHSMLRSSVRLLELLLLWVYILLAKILPFK
jgi:hypothetical protein